MISGLTDLDEKSPLSGIGDNGLPSLIAPLESRRISDDEQGALCPGESDIHPPRVFQKPDRLNSRSTSDTGEDDNVFLLTLKPVHRVESVTSQPKADIQAETPQSPD